MSDRTSPLVGLVHQRRLLDAKILGIVADMDRERDAMEAGYSSLSGYLSAATRMSPRAAARLVAQAKQITQTVTPTGHLTPAPLPHMREAMHAGLIDGDHIDAVADVVGKLPDAEHRDLVEKTLAVVAESSNPKVVRDYGTVLLERLDPDGTLPRDTEPTTNSFRYQRTRHGAMKFTGRIDAEAADELEALLGPAAKPTPHEARPQDERYGDALCEIIHLAASSSDRPSQGGEKPNLNLFVDAVTLHTTTEGGTTLCPHATRRIACDADLIPVLLNADGVPLKVGRTHRLVPAKLRNALIARDRGCAFPHCDRPPRWCDAHHITSWLDGGTTDLDNLVLTCRRHHKILHDSDWQIEIIDRIPYFRPPQWIDPERKLLRNILRQ